MNLKRLTQNHTVNFIRFMVGRRPPYSSVSSVEQRLLAGFARGKRCIIEVGVFEAATSQVFCRHMDPEGKLYLVDPFFPDVRLERLLNLSFTYQIAAKTVRPWQTQVQFVRKPSHIAAAILPLQNRADFIFIDARHDYESVLQDLHCWAPMLAADAVMAFHDSRICDARPDLDSTTGPVRLMRELSEGKHGDWEVIGHADSVTAVRRRATDVGV